MLLPFLPLDELISELEIAPLEDEEARRNREQAPLLFVSHTSAFVIAHAAAAARGGARDGGGAMVRLHCDVAGLACSAASLPLHETLRAAEAPPTDPELRRASPPLADLAVSEIESRVRCFELAPPPLECHCCAPLAGATPVPPTLTLRDLGESRAQGAQGGGAASGVAEGGGDKGGGGKGGESGGPQRERQQRQRQQAAARARKRSRSAAAPAGGAEQERQEAGREHGDGPSSLTSSGPASGLDPAGLFGCHFG